MSKTITNGKIGKSTAKLTFLWYDNLGENQTPLQRNGLPAIPKNVAKFCPCLLETQSNPLFPGTSFGQRPPSLLETLKGILERYPDGGQILKVIIYRRFSIRSRVVIGLVIPSK